MQTLPPIYYIIFTAVTAAGVLLQAFVLLAMFIGIKRTSSKLLETLDEVKSKALPAIASTQVLLSDVSPKLKTATSNLAEVSEVLRSQAGRVNTTVESLLEKTDAQINRVDEMVTATLDALNHASRAIDVAIGVPARRVNGVLHGLKVGVDVLLGKRNGASPPKADHWPTQSPAPVEVPSAAEQKSAKAI